MSLNWGTVLGGTGRPRYLLCGDELVDNRGFESNVYGWSGSPLATAIEREQDSVTFYGDYSLKVADVGAQVSRSRARYTVALTAALASRSFALSFRVKGLTGSCQCSAQVKSLDYEPTVQTKILSTDYEHFFGVFNFVNSVETSFYIDIHAVAGGSYPNTVNVDDVSCREVLYDLYEEFPYHPNRIYPDWTPGVLSSGRLVDGSLKEYMRGWDPRFVVEYDYLDNVTERYRILISEADFVWFQPHYDYEFYVATKWSRDWQQRYFGDVYAGHVGRIAFQSIFLIESKILDV